MKIVVLDSTGTELGTYKLPFIPRVEEGLQLGGEFYIVGDVVYDFDNTGSIDEVPIVITVFSMAELNADDIEE